MGWFLKILSENGRSTPIGDSVVSIHELYVRGYPIHKRTASFLIFVKSLLPYIPFVKLTHGDVSVVPKCVS